MKTIVFSIIVIVLSASFVYSQEEVRNYTKVGQEMPTFAVTDLEGKEFKLADYKGKVVLVFFWATWCPYCQAEMPHLEKDVWQKYKSDDFVMIAIAREQTNEEVAGFRKNNKFSFPMASDPNDEIFKQFGSRGVPRSYVVDRNGKILFQSVGLIPEEFNSRKKIIEKELNKIKKEKTGK